MPSASRSLGRKELRGVLRLCWSESGAPHTLPPSPELLELLLREGEVVRVAVRTVEEVVVASRMVKVARRMVEVARVAAHLVEGQPRETPEPRADQVSPLVDLAREV